MKIVLSDDGSIVLFRTERLTRGQDLSRRIYIEWEGNKNGVETNLAKADDYDEISKFLRYGEGVKEALQLATTSDTKILAKLLTKKQ